MEFLEERVQEYYERNGGGAWWGIAAMPGTLKGVIVFRAHNVPEELVKKNVYRRQAQFRLVWSAAAKFQRPIFFVPLLTLSFYFSRCGSSLFSMFCRFGDLNSRGRG